MGDKGPRTGLRTNLFEGLGIGLAVGLGVCLLTTVGAFESLDRLVVDALQRAFSDPEQADDDILLVVIDQGSMEYFERSVDMRYPWPRSFYGGGKAARG